MPEGLSAVCLAELAASSIICCRAEEFKCSSGSALGQTCEEYREDLLSDFRLRC